MRPLTTGARHIPRPSWTVGERGRFLAASGVGAALALAPLHALVTRGRPDLLQWQRSGNFYDAQAHAWLAGNWEISRRHPQHREVPARRPRLHVPGAVAGVAAPADGRRHHPVRRSAHAALDDPRRARGHGRDHPPPLAGPAPRCAPARRCAGPTSSWRPWPPSRSGAARRCCTEASRAVGVPRGRGVGCGLDDRRHRRGGGLHAAARADGASRGQGLATTLAMCSRSSVALGAVAALADPRRRQPASRGWRAVVATGVPGSAGCAGQRSAPRADGTLPVLAPALAAFVPVAVYATVNYIKFATLFSIPFYSTGLHHRGRAAPAVPRRQRRHALRPEVGAHDGGAVPPARRAPVHLGVSRSSTSRRRPTPSAGCSSTSSTTRAACRPRCRCSPCSRCSASWTLVRTRAGAPGTGVAALRGPTLGALAGGLTILPFAYIANRYLADVVPALVITSLIGVHALLARTTPARGRSTPVGDPGLGDPRRAARRSACGSTSRSP